MGCGADYRRTAGNGKGRAVYSAFVNRTVWQPVAALWSLAIVQPLLGPLGASPEFFVAHRAGAVEILLLTAILAVVPPVAIAVGLGAIARLAARAGAAALAVTIAVLTSALVMQAAVPADASAWFVAVPIAVAAGAGVALADLRLPAVRSFFSILAIAIVVVPVVFLAAPGIRTLIVEPFRRANILPSASSGRPSTNTPVVLVVFDELPLVSLLDRRREIDRALYPNFRALADDGIWFRNATAVSDFTRWAVPAILSGRYPRHDALPTLADHPDNLFTLLGGTHRLEVDETLTALCPARLCAGSRPKVSVASRLTAIAKDLRVVFLHATLTSDLTAGLPKTTDTWAGFGDRRGSAGLDVLTPPSSDDEEAAVPAGETRAEETSRVQAVRRFVSGIDRADVQPSFYFLHALISHHPYGMLPGNKENSTAVEVPGKGGRGWGTDQPWAIAQQYQKQLLQTAFVDGLLGELVQRLKDTGLYDRALIVITSDHGVSFVPGTSQRSFSLGSAADLMRIPLIVKLPASMRIPRRVRDVNAESVDVLPTIADVLDMKVPWAIDGSSLLSGGRRERANKIMLSGASGRQWSMDGSGPNVREALHRKLDLFGDGPANVYRVPRLPPFDRLVGRSLRDLRVIDGGGPVELAHPWVFENVNPDAESVVFDVAGRFGSPRPGAVVAVAVNGVIAAVTRTWEANPRAWLATPEPAVWRRGPNVVEVLVVEDVRGQMQLRRTAVGAVRPADLNLISAEARDWGVLQSNFYGVEGSGRNEMRWTRDWAELSNLMTHTPPREVVIEVAMVPGPPKLLTIQANECTLFEGDVHANWVRTFDLGACPSREDLTLRFTTEAPRGPIDRRRLGVAISRVVVR